MLYFRFILRIILASLSDLSAKMQMSFSLSARIASPGNKSWGFIDFPDRFQVNIRRLNRLNRNYSFREKLVDFCCQYFKILLFWWLEKVSNTNEKNGQMLVYKNFVRQNANVSHMEQMKRRLFGISVTNGEIVIPSRQKSSQIFSFNLSEITIASTDRK